MTADESPDRIEPCLLDVYPPQLADLISEVVGTSAALGQRLHPSTARSLADLVRMMHCYYSNRIEGHTPRPRDIERALNQERDADAERRDLQLEARAHMRVQLLIDDRAARGTLSEPASSEFARWVHAEFFSSSSADGLFPRLFPAQVAL